MAKKFSEATTKTVAEFADPATAYLLGVDVDASPDSFKMVRSELQKLITPSATWTGNGLSIAAPSALSSSSPGLTITQQWNNGATVFTADLVNVTDTASAAGSRLIDRQTGGTSRFSVTKAGSMTLFNDATNNISITPSGSKTTFNAVRGLDLQTGSGWDITIIPGGTITASFPASGGLRLPELAADPNAPSTNNAILYTRDNGSGKTQLCVRFNTGAIQVLSTEP